MQNLKFLLVKLHLQIEDFSDGFGLVQCVSICISIHRPNNPEIIDTIFDVAMCVRIVKSFKLNITFKHSALMRFQWTAIESCGSLCTVKFAALTLYEGLQVTSFKASIQIETAKILAEWILFSVQRISFSLLYTEAVQIARFAGTPSLQHLRSTFRFTFWLFISQETA